MSDPQWERQVLEKLALASVTEQRRSRQWKLFFRLAWLVLAILLVVGILRQKDDGETGLTNDEHAALLNLSGEISSENHTAEGVRTHPSDTRKLHSVPR